MIAKQIRKKQKKLNHAFDHHRLAQKYPKFSRFLKISSKGEQIIDFKSQEAMIALNEAIMDHYFNVKSFLVPIQQLVPTIGNRVNYLEWVKQVVDESGRIIQKIYDVGTGFSGIYIFLAYRMYGWKGIGVDTCEDAIINCRQITQINEIPCEFMVGSLFEFLEDNMVVVCNPPFYSDEVDHNNKGKMQNHESMTEGGEVQFIQQMLDMSTKDCVYTSLIGRRSTYEQFKHMDTVQLLQGNNVRYGVHWQNQNMKQQTI